jgi:hypothetical protein
LTGPPSRSTFSIPIRVNITIAFLIHCGQSPYFFLLLTAIDPFNRQPLTINMVEPVPELKQRLKKHTVTFDAFVLFSMKYIFTLYRINDWLANKRKG